MPFSDFYTESLNLEENGVSYTEFWGPEFVTYCFYTQPSHL